MPIFSFSGERPVHLGVQDGKLATCPNSPNCVSSQADDAEHQVQPLTYSGDAASALAKLKQIIQAIENAQIITETENYLYAEFTSSLMGFVDDVEFYLPPEAQIVHVRSASRLGRSDLGVNRSRIDGIRAKFQG